MTGRDWIEKVGHMRGGRTRKVSPDNSIAVRHAARGCNAAITRNTSRSLTVIRHNCLLKRFVLLYVGLDTVRVHDVVPIDGSVPDDWLRMSGEQSG